MLALLASGQGEDRQAVAGVLAGLNDPRVLPALLAELNNSDTARAAVAAQGLEVVARRSLPLESRDMLLARLLAATQGRHDTIRVPVVHALAAMGDSRAVDRLLELLKDGNSDICIMAVAGLANGKDERILPALLRHGEGNRNR